MAIYDFEDGNFPAEFKNGDNDGWEVTTASANGGTHSLRSGTAGVDRSTSAFWIYGDFQAGDFTCDYRISSEDGLDYGYIIVDGVPIVNNLTGAGAWTSMPAHTLTAGIHVIQFVYVKDNSSQSGDDCLYIDNINVPDFTDIKDKPEYFPSGVPSGWVNDAAHPWITGSVERMPFAGVQSPAIPDNASSSLAYTSPSDAPAGVVFFQGRADSANGDTLKFYVDNVEVYSDQGEAYRNPDHGPVGYFGTVTAGAHEYKWVYSTDSGAQEQSSSGYLYTFYEPSMAASLVTHGAHIGYTTTGNVSYLWEYERGNSTKSPVNISALAEASLGAGHEVWCSISRNGQWMLIRTTRGAGSGWDAMYIASMATYPNSLDFHPVTVVGGTYHPTGIHRITNDGLTIYGVYDADDDQLSKFIRADTSTYDFGEISISAITNAYSTVALSLDETYLIVSVGYDFHKILVSSPYTDTLLLDESAIALSGTISPTPASDGRIVFEGDGNGGDESVYRLDTVNPAETWADLSGSVGNDNSPYVVAEDGDRVLSLYLSRPGNTTGVHELILRDIDGTDTYAPPVLYGISIATNTFTSGIIATAMPITGSGNVTAQDATGSGSGQRVVTGSGDASGSNATASGTGVKTAIGAGNATDSQATGAGVGAVTTSSTGTGSATGNAAIGAGVGQRVIIGSGGGTANPATGSGTDVVPVIIAARHVIFCRRSTDELYAVGK